MSAGLTRSEQWALVAVVGIIAAGLVYQGYRSDAAHEGVWIDSGSRWRPVELASTASAEKTTPTIPVRRATGAQTPSVINLNNATAEELEKLPGIGPTRAREILAFRESIGGFKKVEQIKDVKGIGDKTFERMRPFIMVNDVVGTTATQTTTAPPSPAPPADSSTTRAAPLVESSAPVSARPRKEKPAKKININTAPREELELIPGVGPALAQRIIEHRKFHPFVRPEDLINVKGIGSTSFQKMRPWVTVD